MKTVSRKFIKLLLWAAVTVAVLICGVATLAWRADPLRREYPDVPFSPVGKEYPRLFASREEPPKSDKDEYDTFWKSRQEVSRFLLHEGAMREATEDEREAYRLGVQGSNYPAARDLAARALEANPQSIPARIVFIAVEHEGEGNFPRALFLARTLRRQLHRQGVADPQDEIARDWYLRVLHQEYTILFEMNRSEEVLRVLDLFEQLYGESLPKRRIYPLVKRNRLDAAEAAYKEAEVSGLWYRSLLNDRLILTDARGDREGVYAAGVAATEIDSESQIVWSNHSSACEQNFLPNEAEAALLRSIRCQSGTGYFSPYTYLAELFSSKGQMSEAWDALGMAQRQRLTRPSYTLIMDQYQFDQSVSHVLCLLGRNTEAVDFARRATERPHRVGSTSTSEEETEFSNRFFLWTQLRIRKTQLDEVASGGGRAAGRASSHFRALENELWVLERQILRVLTDEKRLRGLMSPNLPGTRSVSTLFLPDLAQLLPHGVAAETLRRARLAETHPAAAAYFDAIEAELALRFGRDVDAMALAKKALDGLDKDYERALRARVAVVAAEAARRQGKLEEVMPLYDQALADCPVVFRLLNVAIPIKIAEDGSPLANPMAERLLTSPRFRGDPNGFTLTLRAEEKSIIVDFMRQNNIRHFSANVPTQGEATEVIASAVRRIHARLMSPRLDLSVTDIHALDNSLFVASNPQATDRMLRNVTPD